MQFTGISWYTFDGGMQQIAQYLSLSFKEGAFCWPINLRNEPNRR